LKPGVGVVISWPIVCPEVTGSSRPAALMDRRITATRQALCAQNLARETKNGSWPKADLAETYVKATACHRPRAASPPGADAARTTENQRRCAPCMRLTIQSLTPSCSRLFTGAWFKTRERDGAMRQPNVKA
jgi:hypothetical protein